jgi:hypothetical protein
LTPKVRQGEKQRLREVRPTEPGPTGTLGRFSYRRLTLGGLGQDKQCDVVSILGVKDVAGVRARADGLDVEARLFEDFASRADFDRLTELEMPAGRCPRTGAVRATPLPQ